VHLFHQEDPEATGSLADQVPNIPSNNSARRPRSLQISASLHKMEGTNFRRWEHRSRSSRRYPTLAMWPPSNHDNTLDPQLCSQVRRAGLPHDQTCDHRLPCLGKARRVYLPDQAQPVVLLGRTACPSPKEWQLCSNSNNRQPRSHFLRRQANRQALRLPPSLLHQLQRHLVVRDQRRSMRWALAMRPRIVIV
jgi:hypothetical protein